MSVCKHQVRIRIFWGTWSFTIVFFCRKFNDLLLLLLWRFEEQVLLCDEVLGYGCNLAGAHGHSWYHCHISAQEVRLHQKGPIYRRSKAIVIQILKELVLTCQNICVPPGFRYASLELGLVGANLLIVINLILHKRSIGYLNSRCCVCRIH